MTIRWLIAAALAAAWQPVQATEAVSARIIRVREDPGTGRVFFDVTPAVARTCNGTLVASETYVFDADTPGGRALYQQVISAYVVDLNVGTVQYVYVLGTGTCLTLGLTRFEFVSRISACSTFPCAAP